MKYLILITLLLSASHMVIFDFDTDSSLDNWYVMNDGVMGGLSKGNLSINKKGHAVFEGTVSLDNNGGFTSIRHIFEQKEMTGQTKAVIRLKGDGKQCQFRIKTNPNDWYSYIYVFDTSDEWETIEIPLDEMYPSFRGRKLDMPNFPMENLSEITFLIANKKAETFKMEIDKIGLK
jgi:NADH dehydrogenase [ubiquinone] 1 alpha subcomplex assembly factor 1